MLIGADFDNTIVCFDQVFHQVALEQGLISPQVPVNKGDVRDYMRLDGKEQEWIALQGYVYGAGIKDALPFPGVVEFFTQCRESGISACVISHKTRHPFQGPDYDLHGAARKWLEDYGFTNKNGVGLSQQQIYFELTKQEKLDRIAEVCCTYFIDDLPEFLEESGFPAGVERILFDPNSKFTSSPGFHRIGSWSEFGELVAK